MAFASPSFDVGAFAQGLKHKDLAGALRFLKSMEAAKQGEIVPIEPLHMGIKNGFFGKKWRWVSLYQSFLKEERETIWYH